MQLFNRFRSAVGIAAILGTVFAAGSASAQYIPVNLITNGTDADLINPWGVSASGASPVWVSDNGTGKATLYRVDPLTNAVVKQGLVVSIPGAGNPTGQVFNSNAAAFNGDIFLFGSEDGTVSGWRGALGTTAETLQVGSAANVYKGMAIGTVGGNTYSYAANFRTGKIDVIKGTVAAPNLTGAFIDPSLPAGYAPFNVQNLKGTLYVTYALQDGTKADDVAGAGHGFVDAFDLNGNLIGRVGSQGTLNSPWGLTIAPSSFGAFANDLLVGNFGDGTISVFNPVLDTYLGQIMNQTGNTPVSIDGLWSLYTGNNAGSGNANEVFFTAGPNNESGGVLGVLVPTGTPEPGSLALLTGLAAGAISMGIRRRRSVKK